MLGVKFWIRGEILKSTKSWQNDFKKVGKTIKRKVGKKLKNTRQKEVGKKFFKNGKKFKKMEKSLKKMANSCP